MQPVTPFAEFEWMKMKEMTPLAPEVNRVGNSCEQDADEGHEGGPVELRRPGKGNCHDVPEGSQVTRSAILWSIKAHLTRSATFCIECWRAALQSDNQHAHTK